MWHQANHGIVLQQQFVQRNCCLLVDNHGKAQHLKHVTAVKEFEDIYFGLFIATKDVEINGWNAGFQLIGSLVLVGLTFAFSIS